MKKVLFILTLMVSLSILMAVESAPSETVGYFKKSVAANSWETFSLPFYQPDLHVELVIGNQSFAEGDLIQDVSSGGSATYFEGFGWYTDLPDGFFIEYGHAYWVNRLNPTTDYFLLGKVDPQPVTVDLIGNAWNAFSLNIVSPLPIASLPTSGAVEGGLIQDISSGGSATYFAGFGWYTDLPDGFFIEPSRAYWYYRIDPLGYSFTYPSGGRTVDSPFKTSK